ncbi:type II secretion system F family protein [Kocuria palustris]|jgi:tight adherence protein B|uniref:type II secretion system F family protein n=1 Tax=Kocuria palustris TaxID=71999 RepID=UPI0019D04A56|nr:type II secretion system F family protein [Kocuria palustris]MBN6752108.1 type II secretion system F family protein [Kocuria palustris]MBN6757063.1 type II secretion system F family protein [Kocuria palustris]MBN6762091.1 type II secretion system F family protein [Kocuria palustris]MBN6781573.1 type II secretion system F family protein [Kocuria palustris]MBN6798057.1 type II secretion system F family protein [Kocuria palustris]
MITGVLLGLLLGAGLCLIWWSFWTQVTPRAQRRRREGLLRRRLDRAGMHAVRPGSFVLLSVVVAALAAVIVWAVSGGAVFGLCAGIVSLFVPWSLLGRRMRRRSHQLRTVWPDVVDMLRSAIRAGLSLPEALAQLQHRGPEIVQPAFERFAGDYRATGQFLPALDALKEELADPVADNIIESLRVTREVGGTDLGRLLGTLSDFLRENSRTRSELEARQSWTVNAARLSVAAPWLILLLMASQPAAVSAYDSPAGAVVLLGGLAISAIAYRLMLRLGALPEPERVLR